MKKDAYILIFLFIFFGLFALAQEVPPDVTFPILELGNCKSKEACKAYCDLPENAIACLDFAEAHDMLSEEEIEMARKMLETVGTIGGPGGCKNQKECDIYCDNPDNMKECIIFAKEHGLIPPEELPEVEKVLAAIDKGAKPPPCKGKKECDVYCTQPVHLEECVTFGEAAGFITSEEAQMIRKTGGKGPGGCRGKEECDVYCQKPENMEECVNFGIQYGLIPPDEIEDVKKMLEAIKKGVRPPPCRDKVECDVYCSQPEHAEECINFAEAAGFMTPEEAEQARKMAKAGLFGKSPGNCKGKEECDAYCDNPDHMIECIDFAEKAGFMTPEEAEKARKMAELGITGGPGGCKSDEECKAYCDNPDHMEECMNFAQKMGLISPEEAEKAQILGPQGPGGPGGCKTKEECDVYCQDPTHAQECIQFSVERGFISPEEAQRMLEMTQIGPPPQMQPPPTGEMPPIPPEQMMPPPTGEIPTGPGGCKTPEECMQYCSDPSHIQECQQFGAPGEIMPPPPEAPQSLLNQVQKFLASLILGLMGQ